MKLILIRHGETSANKQRIIQGWMDFPLNTQGISEAHSHREKILEEVSKYNINRVHTSTLKCAYHTAEIIFKKEGVPISRVSSLKEMNFGHAGGIELHELKLLYPEHFRSIWNERLWNAKYPRGESFEIFEKRVWSFTEKKISQMRNSEKTLLFVVHGGVIRVIRKNLLGLTRDEAIDSIKNFHVPNLATIMYEIDQNSEKIRAINEEILN